MLIIILPAYLTKAIWLCRSPTVHCHNSQNPNDVLQIFQSAEVASKKGNNKSIWEI